MLNFKRKAKVIQRSSEIINNRMAKSDWLAFNQFNCSDTTKRMNDADVIRLLLHYRQACEQTVRGLVHDFAMKR